MTSDIRRDRLVLVSLAVLDRLDTQYLGAMTPCTLSRLIFLLDAPGPRLAHFELVPGRDAPLPEDVFSQECDEAILELFRRGLAAPGEHTALEITAAGREYLDSFDGSVLTGPAMTEAIDRLGRLTIGYEGPFGTAVLGVAKMFHASMGPRAAEFLAQRYEGVQEPIWHGALATLSA